MKNRGFTLIELVVIIGILGFIATITVPNITSAVSTSRKKALEKQKEMIEDAARRWGSDNALTVKDNDSISVSKLKSEGYLKSENIKNPTKTNQNMDGCIIITKAGNQYKYEYKDTNCPSYTR